MNLPSGPVLDLRSRWDRFVNGLPAAGRQWCKYLVAAGIGGVLASILIHYWK